MFIAVETEFMPLVDGYRASIEFMREAILAPKYAATGDARDWAESAMRDVQSALAAGDDAPEHLDAIFAIGAEYFHSVTGLHAVQDGALMVMTEEESARWCDGEDIA